MKKESITTYLTYFQGKNFKWEHIYRNEAPSSTFANKFWTSKKLLVAHSDYTHFGYPRRNIEEYKKHPALCFFKKNGRKFKHVGYFPLDVNKRRFPFNLGSVEVDDNYVVTLEHSGFYVEITWYKIKHAEISKLSNKITTNKDFGDLPARTYQKVHTSLVRLRLENLVKGDLIKSSTIKDGRLIFTVSDGRSYTQAYEGGEFSKIYELKLPVGIAWETIPKVYSGGNYIYLYGRDDLEGWGLYQYYCGKYNNKPGRITSKKMRILDITISGKTIFISNRGKIYEFDVDFMKTLIRTIDVSTFSDARSILALNANEILLHLKPTTNLPLGGYGIYNLSKKRLTNKVKFTSNYYEKSVGRATYKTTVYQYPLARGFDKATMRQSTFDKKTLFVSFALANLQPSRWTSKVHSVPAVLELKM